MSCLSVPDHGLVSSSCNELTRTSMWSLPLELWVGIEGGLEAAMDEKLGSGKERDVAISTVLFRPASLLVFHCSVLLASS